MNNQQKVIEALKKPEAYDEQVRKIESKQTHISYIFLTESFGYKIKKAVNFGFLDFSTLEKRNFFCREELKLNKRLCEDMYLEVVSINEAENIRIGGEGKPIEYAVKMKRIPEEKIMTKLLEKRKINKKIIDKIAKIIVEFHRKARTNKKISNFGSVEMIENNWKENFDQTKEFIGKTITQTKFNFLSEKTSEFMNQNKDLFAKRVHENRIRECHGDIHSGNIFVADKIYIFDAIEFNERFRYCDVASEIAFLAMDLDFKERRDLSKFFVEKYIEYSGESKLLKILDFYKCYRAYVRGKVVSFKLNDKQISKKEKNEAAKCAKAYFELAVSYATEL